MLDSLLVMILSLGAAYADRAEVGRLQVGPGSQVHLKAQIALFLAAEVTGESRFASAAADDLEGLIDSRMTDSGGVLWRSDPGGPYFDCHQSWLLVSSEMALRAVGAERGIPWVCKIRRAQIAAAGFALGDNPGRCGFLEANHRDTGAEWAYRSLDDDGNWQTQADWVGSYEIGASLWAACEGFSAIPADIVAEALPAFAAPDGRGYARGRALSGGIWMAAMPRDRKYAAELGEAALIDRIHNGARESDWILQSEIEEVLDSIRPDGSVAGVPDEHGTLTYEVGLVMSVLGLGAVAYRDDDPLLAARCMDAGSRVAALVCRTYPIDPDEGGTVLLRGLCRMASALSVRSRPP